MSTGPLRLALYSGICMRGDAISTSLRYKLETQRALAAAGVPLEANVFTHGSDFGDPAVIEVPGVHDVARQPEFHAAHAHLFEFGIHYDLFDTVHILPEDRPVVATYHNITPPELAHSWESRQVLGRSLVQKHNLFRADRVLCDSEFNRDDLLGFGIPAERLSVLHLPPAIVPPPHRERAGDTVELLFVGRFVPAKGVLDLVRAVTVASRGGTTGMRLTLAGNPVLSSPECMRDLEELVRLGELDGVVRVVPFPDQEQLASLYAGSDALVIPSYHEGYCMPVVEALSAQCHVIAYDAGNLPYIIDGLGTLVRTGNVEALARAIADFVARSQAARRDGTAMMVPTRSGPLTEEEWRHRVAAHLDRHSTRAFRDGMVETLRWIAERTGHRDVVAALDRVAEQAIAGVAG